MSRVKHDFITASKDQYLKFKEKHKEIDITQAQFFKIIYKYNELFLLHLLETGDAVKMPYGLGEIAISKYKQRWTKRNYRKTGEIPNLAIDWIATKKEGKKIYILNSHTDGYRFFWRWDHKSSYIFCNDIWKFKVHRTYARLLAKYLKDKTKDYKEIYKEYSRWRTKH